MRDWVLGKDKEVTKHYQVSCDESGIGMTKQVSTAARLRAALFFLVTPFIGCRLGMKAFCHIRELQSLIVLHVHNILSISRILLIY